MPPFSRFLPTLSWTSVKRPRRTRGSLGAALAAAGLLAGCGDTARLPPGADEGAVGFVSRGDAWGRPVGVALDVRGALLVADDVGNTVWRVARR